MVGGRVERRSKNLKEIMRMFCPSAGSPFILLVSLESADAIVSGAAPLFRRVHLSKQKGWRLRRVTAFSVRTSRRKSSGR